MFIWNEGDLNKEQEDTIKEKNSVLLVACPGSGKTRTLTYKIAYELSRLDSNKKYIIAITYTNAAADEIKERIDFLGVNTSQLWIGTIHAFCLEWILRPYGLYSDRLKNGFKVLNSFESEELISTLCKPYKGSKVTFWDCGFLATPSGYSITSTDASKRIIIKTILEEYFKILKTNGQIDFEQILYYSFKLLKEKPFINQILSNLFPFILIDEYQDTKEIQYHIIASIIKSGKGNSKVLIVGDPNQSIYETLGGYAMEQNDLEVLLGFSLKNLSLSKNYRSSSKIVEYFEYYKVFSNKIIPSGLHKEYDSIITFNNSVNKDDLEDEIVKLIQFNIIEKGISQNEICIAAPQWIPLANLTRGLMVKLPDYSFDGPGMVPFARDLDNFWYKLCRIILTEPSPYLYLRRLRWSREVLEELDAAGVDVSGMTKKLFLKLCNTINIKEEKGLKYLEVFFEEICQHLKITLSVFPVLEEHYDSFFNSSKKRIEKLEAKGNPFIGTIENFKKVFKQKKGIKVSTIHGTKGEEYDTVIGYGLLDSWVPFFSDENGVENSKKMLYVLSSRARKNLHLISETRRNVHRVYRPDGLQPTSHLIEYDFDYDEFQEG